MSSTAHLVPRPTLSPARGLPCRMEHPRGLHLSRLLPMVITMLANALACSLWHKASVTSRIRSLIVLSNTRFHLARGMHLSL